MNEASPSPTKRTKRKWARKKNTARAVSLADPEDEEEEDYDPIEYIWLTKSMRT